MSVWIPLLMSLWHSCFQLVVASAAGASASRTAWNFAFGSNLDQGTRDRRGLQPIQLVPARARGWELTFSLQGAPYIEPAFAALRPAPPSSGVVSHGLCLELDKEGWLRLLQTESVLDAGEASQLRLQDATLEDVFRVAEQSSRDRKGGYRLEALEVEPYKDGPPFTAYTLAASSIEDESTNSEDAGAAAMSLMAPPSERYWRLLRNGAARHRLAPEYRDFLAALPRYRPSPLVLAAVPAALLAAPILAVIAGLLLLSRRLGLSVGPARGGRWPALQGPAAALRGRLVTGVEPRPGVWDAFCSIPRQEVVRAATELVGDA